MTESHRLSVNNVLFNLFMNTCYFFLLWDLGGVPYPTLTNTELYRLLNSGYRMEKPDMCCDEV